MHVHFSFCLKNEPKLFCALFILFLLGKHTRYPLLIAMLSSKLVECSYFFKRHEKIVFLYTIYKMRKRDTDGSEAILTSV